MFVISVLVGCKKEERKVYENLSFEEVLKMAEKQNCDFCIVLSNLECDACFVYADLLNEKYKELNKKAIFNIVKTDDEQNQWYKFWLYTPAAPITCIFNSSGNLKSIISGASIKSFQSIEKSIDQILQDKLVNYSSPLTDILDNDRTHEILDNILQCKLAFDKGEDITYKINETLNVVWYPYNVYLNCLNEKNKGNNENAKYIAEQILTFKKNNFCNYLYSNLFEEVHKIINSQNIDTACIIHNTHPEHNIIQ